jgi:hypothetical protein
MTKRQTWAVTGLMAACLAGCDDIETRREPLTTLVEQRPTPDASADGGPAVAAQSKVDAMAPGAPTPDAPGVCHQYCEALRETNIYYCLVHGQGDAAGCAAQVPQLLGQCEQLRCVPGLVDAPLCLEQCASLAALYAPYCASATPAPETPCPATSQAHDDACRAGCAARAP